MFTETPQVRRKLRQESVAKWVFFGMAASMIVPLILIIGYLVERAWPSLSLSFLIDVPLHGMKVAVYEPALPVIEAPAAEL